MDRPTLRIRKRGASMWTLLVVSALVVLCVLFVHITRSEHCKDDSGDDSSTAELSDARVFSFLFLSIVMVCICNPCISIFAVILGTLTSSLGALIGTCFPLSMRRSSRVYGAMLPYTILMGPAIAVFCIMPQWSLDFMGWMTGSTVDRCDFGSLFFGGFVWYTIATTVVITNSCPTGRDSLEEALLQSDSDEPNDSETEAQEALRRRRRRVRRRARRRRNALALERLLESLPRIVYREPPSDSDITETNYTELVDEEWGSPQQSGAEFRNICSSCAICIEDYAEGKDELIVLPCRHGFHEECIQSWLSSSQQRRVKSCPVCKAQLTLPTVTDAELAAVGVVVPETAGEETGVEETGAEPQGDLLQHDDGGVAAGPLPELNSLPEGTSRAYEEEDLLRGYASDSVDVALLERAARGASAASADESETPRQSQPVAVNEAGGTRHDQPRSMDYFPMSSSV